MSRVEQRYCGRCGGLYAPSEQRDHRACQAGAGLRRIASAGHAVAVTHTALRTDQQTGAERQARWRAAHRAQARADGRERMRAMRARAP